MSLRKNIDKELHSYSQIYGNETAENSHKESLIQLHFAIKCSNLFHSWDIRK